MSSAFGARAPPRVYGPWSFNLEPAPDHTTRFVMLSLAARSRITDRVFWERAHFVMEWKMMLTIKRLAERGRPGA